MAYDFPNAPTVGQVFQGWVWDGAKWNAQGAAASGAVRYDTPQGLTANQQAQGRQNIGVPAANLIINGDFRVNQVGYVSAAALSAGTYGHDQWKAGAGGGDYSFAQLKSSTQITIAAGKSLIQPIEDANVVGGSYVLSWTGTAQARAGVNTLTPSGSYAGSPLLITGQSAATAMSVEFNSGTLGIVKLEIGASATPFIMRPYDQELLVCKRYFQKVGGDTLNDLVFTAYAPGAGAVGTQTLVYGIEMRAVPTVIFVGTWTFGNATGIVLYQGSRSMSANLTASAAGIAYYAPSAGAFMTLSARL